MGKRLHYPIEGIRLVKEHYHDMPARSIAEATGMTVLQVYRLASALELPRKAPEHYTPQMVDQIRSLHAEGLTDAEISRRIGKDRRTISDIRASKLRLPVNIAAVKEAGRRAVASQMKTLGIRHGGDLRRLAFAKFARRNGWPDDLRPREVQILNVLAERGPQTKVELADAIGMRSDGRNSKHGGPKSLHGNGPGGTYTASLIRRGLVYRQSHWRGGRAMLAQLPSTYMLTPLAVIIREKCLEQLERERCASTNEASQLLTARRRDQDAGAVRRGGLGGEAERGRVRRGEGD